MSTERCLQLLRQGNYFCALEWLTYLSQNYAETQHELLDADTLLILAIFELINSSFNQSDFAKIERLYSLLDGLILNDASLISGEVAYASTVLINAAIQCSIYLEENIAIFYQNKTLTSLDAIKEWMTRENAYLTVQQNNDKLSEKYYCLNKKLVLSNHEVNVIKDRIEIIITYRAQCKKYINALNELEVVDERTAMRCGVLKSLYYYLRNQVMLTSEVSDTMAAFITKIRSMQPAPWEEDYLSQLLRKTFMQKLSFFTCQIFANIMPIFDESNNDHPKI